MDLKRSNQFRAATPAGGTPGQLGQQKVGTTFGERRQLTQSTPTTQTPEQPRGIYSQLKSFFGGSAKKLDAFPSNSQYAASPAENRYQQLTKGVAAHTGPLSDEDRLAILQGVIKP